MGRSECGDQDQGGEGEGRHQGREEGHQDGDGKELHPGEIIHYTILYRNTGNENATNAVVSDPIPKGTVYIPGSATETGELSFSIDGGKTFKKPALLTYETKAANGAVEKRVASPEEYTHIRWVIDKIPAGANGKVSFQVKVK